MFVQTDNERAMSEGDFDRKIIYTIQLGRWCDGIIYYQFQRLTL